MFIRTWFRQTQLSMLYITCVATIFYGCGLSVQQRAAIERFSVSTGEFAELASSEFVKSRTDVLEMNKLRLQLQDDTVKVTQIDEHFSVERVKVRVEAMAALKGYADLLHVLVTTSQELPLRNAADSFVASLRKVQGVSLSDEKAGAIAAAVQGVGGLIVEYMRAQAAREVVNAVHPTILQILELVRRDFDPAADHWSLGYEKIIVGLEGAAGLAAAGPNAAGTAALVGEAQVVAAQNRSRFRSVAEQVNNTAVSLREAQVNLRYAVHTTDVTMEDINSFAAKIDDFVKVYRILRDR